MKRSGRNGKELPVQKTTLLNFFSRTSSTNVTKNTGEESVTRNVTVTELSVKIVKCPACLTEVPETSINSHLDIKCNSSPRKKNAERNEEADDEVMILLDSATSSTTSILSTPSSSCPDMILSTPPKSLLVNKQAASTSKKDEVRRAEIASQNLTQITRTTPRKGSRYSSFRYLNKTSSPDKGNVVKSLFKSTESLQSPAKQKLKYDVPYYLDHFRVLINTSINEKVNEDLFDDEDINFVQKFCSLSVEAQKLYVRLFSRKLDWHRASRLDYEEIGSDLKPVLKELHEAKLVDCDDDLTDLEDILRLLSLPEIKSLCKDVKLPQNSKNVSVKSLMELCRTQRSIYGGTTLANTISKLARQIISPCYKIANGPRRTFLRMLLLTQLHRCLDDEEDKGKQQSLVTHLMVSMGRMMYPQYEIIRTRKIFPDRQHLIEFEDAIHLEFQSREALENQDWTKAIEVGDTVHVLLEKRLQDTTWDLSLPMFLRRFTSGSLYTYCLWKRVEAYQRLRRYKEAVDQLEYLIQQNVYLLYYRGKWYERLALNVDQHLKHYDKALEIITNGLTDPWVSPSHKLALSLRAKKIFESSKSKNLQGLLSDLPLLHAADPPTVTISGRCLPRDLPGHKSMFIRGDSQVTPADGDVTLCSVEELVLGYYKDQGYSEGMHAEGSTMVTLLGLFFWDILYHSDVPDTFLSPHQPIPLDLGSEEFYETRKTLIDARLASIVAWSTDQLAGFLTEIWDKNHGSISLVGWNRFRNLEHAQSLVESIRRESLVAVFRRMLSNYNHYRAGFPDLVVWDPVKKECRIVEVKGPNDRLSNKQILWINFLIEAGISTEVCHVKAVGTKRMSTNNGPLEPRTPEKTKLKINVSSAKKNPVKRRRTKKNAKNVEDNSDDDFI